MDGVLCDFEDAACHAHRTTAAQMNSQRMLGEPMIVKPLSRLLRRNEMMTLDEFWEPIGPLGAGFWSGMIKPTPWIDDMRQIIAEHEGSYILTQPSGPDIVGCVKGKMEWCREQFPTMAMYLRVLATPYKYLLANPNSLLIDDNEDNVRLFELNGGKAILFPTLGNRLYNLRHDPVSYVREQLAKLRSE